MCSDNAYAAMCLVLGKKGSGGESGNESGGSVGKRKVKRKKRTVSDEGSDSEDEADKVERKRKKKVLSDSEDEEVSKANRYVVLTALFELNKNFESVWFIVGERRLLFHLTVKVERDTDLDQAAGLEVDLMKRLLAQGKQHTLYQIQKKKG